MKKHGVVVERTLVDISIGQAVLWICNPTGDEIELKANTTVGICQPVDLSSIQDADDNSYSEILNKK